MPQLGYGRQRAAGCRAPTRASVGTGDDSQYPISGTGGEHYGPGPLGALCVNDRYARNLAAMCLEQGMRIPEDVAIIGIDDATFHTTQSPGITSLSSPGFTVGLSLSRAMVDWVAGAAPPRTILIPFRHVVQRESTDLFLGCSAEIANALRYLRKHACDAINIDDIVRITGVSRRSLDRHAKRLFGHSPLAEIHRLRLETAQRPLADINLTIGDVAKSCGFEDPKHFHRVFRQSTGTSPGAWRESM